MPLSQGWRARHFRGIARGDLDPVWPAVAGWGNLYPGAAGSGRARSRCRLLVERTLGNRRVRRAPNPHGAPPTVHVGDAAAIVYLRRMNNARRGARSFVVLLGLGVIAACASAGAVSGKTPTAGDASCEVDSDCVITTGESCCALCVENPRAIPASEHQRQQARCAVIDCTIKPADERSECPKVESPAGYRAKCERGTCAATKR